MKKQSELIITVYGSDPGAIQAAQDLARERGGATVQCKPLSAAPPSLALLAGANRHARRAAQASSVKAFRRGW